MSVPQEQLMRLLQGGNQVATTQSVTDSPRANNIGTGIDFGNLAQTGIQGIADFFANNARSSANTDAFNSFVNSPVFRELTNLRQAVGGTAGQALANVNNFNRPDVTEQIKQDLFTIARPDLENQAGQVMSQDFLRGTLGLDLGGRGSPLQQAFSKNLGTEVARANILGREAGLKEEQALRSFFLNDIDTIRKLAEVDLDAQSVLSQQIASEGDTTGDFISGLGGGVGSIISSLLGGLGGPNGSGILNTIKGLFDSGGATGSDLASALGDTDLLGLDGFADEGLEDIFTDIGDILNLGGGSPIGALEGIQGLAGDLAGVHSALGTLGADAVAAVNAANFGLGSTGTFTGGLAGDLAGVSHALTQAGVAPGAVSGLNAFAAANPALMGALGVGGIFAVKALTDAVSSPGGFPNPLAGGAGAAPGQPFPFPDGSGGVMPRSEISVNMGFHGGGLYTTSDFGGPAVEGGTTYETIRTADGQPFKYGVNQLADGRKFWFSGNTTGQQFDRIGPGGIPNPPRQMPAPPPPTWEQAVATARASGDTATLMNLLHEGREGYANSLDTGVDAF